MKTDSPEIRGNFDVLLRVHKTLYRLESIFLFQVLSLREAEDELTALTLLKFMVETADRILSTHDDIRCQRTTLIDLGVNENTLDDLLDEREIHRRHAEKRFRNSLKKNFRPDGTDSQDPPWVRLSLIWMRCGKYTK